MKIVERSPVLKEFEDIPVGEVFRLHGNYYICIEECTVDRLCPSESERVFPLKRNAVDISDGSLVYVRNSEPIEIVSAKVHINDYIE